MDRWKNDDIEFLKHNYKLLPYKTIAIKLGKTESAIRAKCFELSLVKNDRWAPDDIRFLSEHFSEYSIQELADKLYRTPNSVKVKANKLGLKKYPYNCDYKFFSRIDTEDKAYWLGFISADGWVSINHDTNSGCLGIELQASDIDHLRKCNKSLSGNYKIVNRQSTYSISTNPDKVNDHCMLRIYSISLVRDLMKLGVVPNKTYGMDLPIIPDELMRHYIRGYFDGDGCVRIRTRQTKKGAKRYPICDIVSYNKIFLEQLRSYLYSHENICSYIYKDKEHCYRLYIHKLDHTISFLNYIYNDSNVYLDRKYYKYKEILETYKSKDCLAS